MEISSLESFINLAKPEFDGSSSVTDWSAKIRQLLKICKAELKIDTYGLIVIDKIITGNARVVWDDWDSTTKSNILLTLEAFEKYYSGSAERTRKKVELRELNFLNSGLKPSEYTRKVIKLCLAVSRTMDFDDIIDHVKKGMDPTIWSAIQYLPMSSTDDLIKIMEKVDGNYKGDKEMNLISKSPPGRKFPQEGHRGGNRRGRGRGRGFNRSAHGPQCFTCGRFGHYARDHQPDGSIIIKRKEIFNLQEDDEVSDEKEIGKERGRKREGVQKVTPWSPGFHLG